MLLLAVLALFFAAPGAVRDACAVAGAPTSCDPEYMDALESKAWLLGQRRITQNQNLITKPDSVLEYSCFDQFVGYVAANNARRFSEQFNFPLWGPVTAVTDTSLDTALIETTYIPLVTYLQANFQHTYLGGRADAVATPPPAWGQYNCTAMQYVSQLARCRNFIQIVGLDSFFDFPHYADRDPRILPPEILACDPPTAAYNAAMNSAYNADHALFTLATDNNPFDDDTPYEEDPIYQVNNFHLDLILAGDCANSAVIPTGITVARDDGFVVDEHVCSTPGCSYDGAACVP